MGKVWEGHRQRIGSLKEEENIERKGEDIMSFEIVDNVLNITVDSTMTLAMAAVLLLIGYFVRRKASFLTKYCVSPPLWLAGSCLCL